MPAAEREASDAGRGDDAARHGEAEGVGGVVHVAPGRASLDAYGPRLRVYADAVHVAEVDDESPVADAEARRVVTSAADRQRQPLAPRVADGGDHVGDVGAADDALGVPVDHPVVDAAGVVVRGVGGVEEVAAQQTSQLGERGRGGFHNRWGLRMAEM